MRLKNRLNIFIFFCLVNLIILLVFQNKSNFLNTGISISTQFLRVGASKVVSFFVASNNIFTSKKNILAENARLENEILEYREQLKSIDSLIFENNKLRSLLQFNYSIDYEIVPSNIISSIRNEGANQFIIDKGKIHGLEAEYIVCGIYKDKLVLLGKIFSVSRNTAIFQSIKEYDYVVPVVTEYSHQKGLLVGEGELSKSLKLRFDTLYQSKSVLVGEEVLVYQYSTNYPRGIPVGLIQNIETNEDDLLVSADVEPFLDPTTLDVVMVLLADNFEDNELDVEKNRLIQDNLDSLSSISDVRSTISEGTDQ